jgi:hypothetical protein
MQGVYDHTVTAELTQAADRARVLIHPGARVYLVTNEPCPKLWFAEMCYAGDLLDLSATAKPRSDFAANFAAYEEAAVRLLDARTRIGNADVCRELGRKPCAGWRYWKHFMDKYGDALEGERKVRWKYRPEVEEGVAEEAGPPPQERHFGGMGPGIGPYDR